jgi:hypothetical protein
LKREIRNLKIEKREEKSNAEDAEEERRRILCRRGHGGHGEEEVASGEKEGKQVPRVARDDNSLLGGKTRWMADLKFG